jgi:tripartite-type tricarboxylate transporter receptor subunit TctC
MKILVLVPSGGEPDAVARVIANDHSRYGKLIKEAGIQVE